MIQINLLPHRQLKREARKRQFGLMAAMVAAAAAALLFMGWTINNQWIESQNDRNARLSAAADKLDKEIADIKDLQDQIKAMLERKQIVENLQTNRSQSVVILDELSRKMPEGMYYKSIKQQESNITIEGVADTNARVATFLHSLDISEWMEPPAQLGETKAVTNGNLKQNSFTINVRLKAPSASVDANKKNENKGTP